MRFIAFIVAAWILTATFYCAQLSFAETVTIQVPEKSFKDEIMPEVDVPIYEVRGFIIPVELMDEFSEGDAEYISQVIVYANEACEEMDVDITYFWTVWKYESGYCHYRNDGRVKRGGAGEVGGGQILPDGMKIKQKYDLFDLKENIYCTVDLLRFAIHERGYEQKRVYGWYNSGRPIINGYARRAHEFATTAEFTVLDAIREVTECTE